MFLELPAHGMMYSWSDSSGITHYVNREYDIPARYRARAKALYPEPSDSLTPQQNLLPLNVQLPGTQTQAKPEDLPKVTQPVVTPTKKRTRKLIAGERKGVGRHRNPKNISESEKE